MNDVVGFCFSHSPVSTPNFVPLKKNRLLTVLKSKQHFIIGLVLKEGKTLPNVNKRVFMKWGEYGPTLWKRVKGEDEWIGTIGTAADLQRYAVVLEKPQEIRL